MPTIVLQLHLSKMAKVEVEWVDDCLACLIANSVSFVSPPPGPRLFLCGEEGTIAFGIPGSESKLSVATLNKGSQYYVPPPRRARDGRPGRPAQVSWYHFPGNAFPSWRYTVGSTQHLYECIVNDTEPLPSVEWGCHVAEIMIKSFESSEQGKALELTTTF